MHYSYSRKAENNDRQKFIETNVWYTEVLSTQFPLEESIQRLLEILTFKAIIGVPDMIYPYERTFTTVKAHASSLIKKLPEAMHTSAENYVENIKDISEIFNFKKSEQSHQRDIVSRSPIMLSGKFVLPQPESGNASPIIALETVADLMNPGDPQAKKVKLDN